MSFAVPIRSSSRDAMRRAGPAGLLLWVLTLCGAPAAFAAAPASPTEARQELQAFLARWNDAMSAQNAPAIRASYVADDRLRWFEDGALRYRATDEILHALAQFPPGSRIETTLTEIEGEWLTPKLIQGSATFRTRVTMPGRSFEYAGVFTLVIERDGPDGRFLRGHTSTTRPGRAR